MDKDEYLGRMSDLISIVRELAEENEKRRTEIITLSGIVATALTEIAITYEDADVKLGQMVAGLQGVALAVADMARKEERLSMEERVRAGTALTEHVASMAEAMLVRRKLG